MEITIRECEKEQHLVNIHLLIKENLLFQSSMPARIEIQKLAEVYPD